MREMKRKGHDSGWRSLARFLSVSALTDRAVAEHDGWFAEFIFHPTYDPLRSHPRYAALLQALGLR